jgi:thiol-disulfide isomerase/thioredoxin
MKFKHIVKEGEDLNTLNKHISEGKNAFILVYSDDCGHCVEVLPKWKKIEEVLSAQYKNTDSIIVASVNVKDKNRETSSFVNWIEIKLDNHHSHIDKKNTKTNTKTNTKKNKTRNKVGGKSRNKNKKKQRRSRKYNK